MEDVRDMNLRSFMKCMLSPLIEMGDSNMLPTLSLSMDMRLGLYYAAEVYHVGFHFCSRASWEWISVSQGEDAPWLTGNEVMDLEPDMEKLNKHLADYVAGIFPEGYKKDVPPPPETKMPSKYGWLSPEGEFDPSPWGMHEGEAFKIVERNGWEKSDEVDLWRTYLIEERGYVLIDSPGLDGIVVTHTKPLTKAQRAFLFKYFNILGNGMRAEMYREGA